VFTVIGRVCPWEIVHYALRWRWPRLKMRFARSAVPAAMNKHTIWTRYYTPREFYRAFERDFTLEHYRGLCVFAPPPYLTGCASGILAFMNGCGGSIDARRAGRCCVRSAITS
jgi:hypothetical protein